MYNHNYYRKSNKDLPNRFVLVSDVIPEVIQEIRYYGAYNFVEKRID